MISFQTTVFFLFPKSLSLELTPQVKICQIYQQFILMHLAKHMHKTRFFATRTFSINKNKFIFSFTSKSPEEPFKFIKRQSMNTGGDLSYQCALS